MTDPKCADEVEFYSDGRMFLCDREPDHMGRHSFSGAAAILSWADR